MALLGFFYEIEIICDNCGFRNNLKVKKGVKINDFLKSKRAKCSNCGCAIEANEYVTQGLKKQTMNELKGGEFN